MEAFYLMRLLSYGLFLYLPILWFVSALLFARTQRLTAMGCACTALFLWLVAADAFLVEPRWLQESTYVVSTERLNQPIRIALIADLQTDDFGDYERRALQRCMSYQPDLLLLAGDYVQARNDEEWTRVKSAINDFLKGIQFGAPLGAFAVQGNTDHSEWQQIFNGVGVQRIALTESIDITPELRLTGLSIRDSFDRNLQIDPSDSFHIVLGHAPDYALGRVEADLLLAGHTHGGQVRLPLIGPLMTASQIPRSWAAGRTRIDDDTTLVVSPRHRDGTRQGTQATFPLPPAIGHHRYPAEIQSASMSHYEVIVVGAGAAGLMAGIRAAELGHQVPAAREESPRGNQDPDVGRNALQHHARYGFPGNRRRLWQTGALPPLRPGGSQSCRSGPVLQ